METEPPKGWRLATERDHSEWVSLQPAGTVVVYTREEDEDIYLVYRQKEGGRFWYAVDVKTNDYHISDTVEEAIASLNGWMLAAEVKHMYGDAHEYMRKYTRKHGEGGLALRIVENEDEARWTASSGAIKASGGSAKAALLALMEMHKTKAAVLAKITERLYL